MQLNGTLPKRGGDNPSTQNLKTTENMNQYVNRHHILEGKTYRESPSSKIADTLKRSECAEVPVAGKILFSQMF